MLYIEINEDGKPSKDKVELGNRWENNDEVITFSLPNKFNEYFKYLVAVHKKNHTIKTKIIPIIENKVIISSAITSLNGYWHMYVMCRSGAIDIASENIDIAARANEHVFISDGFIGIVNKNNIDKSLVDNIQLDTNLQIIYDDLFKLKADLEDKLGQGGYGISTWDELKDKPAEFPPTDHGHDELYYTKTELDESFEEISNEEIEEMFRIVFNNKFKMKGRNRK